MTRPSRFAAMGLALLAASGCHKGGFAHSPAPPGVLRYAIATHLTTLDPGLVQDPETIDVLQNVYEGLVSFGPDNQIRPQLALGWQIKDGGKTYVFNLRRDATFQDGHPLRAQAFVWTIDRNTDPKLASPVAGTYLAPIQGVAQREAGKAQTVAGVKALDDHTLQITLDKPRPYFLSMLTYPVAFVLEPGVAPEHARIDDIEQAVGTGPFRFSAFIPDQIIRLERFDRYYGGEPPLTQIDRPVILDPETRLAKFEAGDLDLLVLERADVAGVRKDPTLAKQLQFIDRPTVAYLCLNPAASPAFKDPRVRRAIAMAVDRGDLVRSVLAGVDSPAYGILPPGVPAHRDKAAVPPFDPQSAKGLLTQAGFPNGKGLNLPALAYEADNADAKLVAETLQDQLRKNLGLDVSLQAMAQGALLQRRNNKQLPMYLESWQADYLDPQDFLSLLFMSDSQLNFYGYDSPAFDSDCLIADSDQNPDERARLYQRAEDTLLQDSIWVPLYFVRDAILVSPRVHNLQTSTLFGFMPHRATSAGP